MSLLKHLFSIRAIMALTLCALAGGCNLRPVYAPVKGAEGGEQVAGALAAIHIDDARDRVAQELRNRLIFNFNRGRDVAQKSYRFSFSLARSDDAVAIEEFSGAPASYRLTLTVRYRLTDSQSGAQLTQGTVRVSASYDRSSQSFANLRARRDAENRTAVMAGDEITRRLSSYFGTRL